MSAKIRFAELNVLNQTLISDKPEFLAIYGRRRIGKTYLIREFFSPKKLIFFNTTGSKKGALQNQIKHFTEQIGKVFYHGAALAAKKNWDDTFDLLNKAIENQPKNKKIVLFMDEFPWMATPKSKLLEALDYYWNQYWSRDPRIKLIICGSSASWIINKIVNNKGGLHNRLTKRISLDPLDLHSTKILLASQKVKLTNKHILEIYLATGGVPYYLSEIPPNLSATQIINQFAFKNNSLLLNEFENLFSSLFDDYEVYEKIVRIISSYRSGIEQQELLLKLGKKYKGKKGLTILKNLMDTAFITRFKSIFNERKGIYYKIIDEYTLFYLKWIAPLRDNPLKKALPGNHWEMQRNMPSYESWAGLAFESICYKHVPQIVAALKLNVAVIPGTWRYVPRDSTEEGAQIDLLFDRADDSITLCEIKYTDSPFIIDKDYAKKLLKKVEIFKNVTKTTKQIFLVMISASGVKRNMYSEEIINAVVTLNDLFL